MRWLTWSPPPWLMAALGRSLRFEGSGSRDAPPPSRARELFTKGRGGMDGVPAARGRSMLLSPGTCSFGSPCLPRPCVRAAGRARWASIRLRCLLASSPPPFTDADTGISWIVDRGPNPCHAASEDQELGRRRLRLIHSHTHTPTATAGQAPSADHCDVRPTASSARHPFPPPPPLHIHTPSSSRVPRVPLRLCKCRRPAPAPEGAAQFGRMGAPDMRLLFGSRGRLGAMPPCSHPTSSSAWLADACGTLATRAHRSPWLLPPRWQWRG
jgi:hypothetical protein